MYLCIHVFIVYSCTVLRCIVNRPLKWHIAHITRKMSKSRTGQRSKKKKKKKRQRRKKRRENKRRKMRKQKEKNESSPVHGS